MKSTFTFVLFTWCVLPVIALDYASLRGIDSWERLLQASPGTAAATSAIAVSSSTAAATTPTTPRRTTTVATTPTCGQTCVAKLVGNSDNENYKEDVPPRRCCNDEECQPEGDETFPGSEIYNGRCVPKRCVGQSENDNPNERGSHRVTICHRTCSEKILGFVLLLIAMLLMILVVDTKCIMSMKLVPAKTLVNGAALTRII